MPLPDEATLFGASQTGAPAGGLPTPEQLFPDTAPPSGAAHDTVWSSLQNAGARILNYAGAGFSDAWGARPLGLDEDSEAAMRKAGVFNDYQAGHDSFMKSVNEAFIRPAAAFADLAARAIPSIAAGAGAGFTQAAEEAKPLAPPVSGALGAAGELAYAGGEGLIGPEFNFQGPVTAGREAQAYAAGRTEQVAGAAAARSVGALGESEAGYYDATPPTPENVQARTTAAQEAGVEPLAPEPPPPDIHALARRIDPDTFDQYDALALEREQHRATIAQLQDERENSPEAAAARTELNAVLGIEGEVSGREMVSRLQALQASAPDAMVERANAAFDRLDAALFDDTPEMRQARAAYLDADRGMRELSPEVSAAYRQAHDMAPDIPITAPQAEAEGAKPTDAAAATEKATAEGEAQAGEAQLTPEQEAGIRAAPVAAAEAQAEGAPANVEAQPTGALATKPAAGRGNLRAVEGTGETVTRGLSEGVEETAIEQGLTDAFGDLPEYQRVSMADQAARVAKLMNEDYETAKAVAMGTRQPPEGILPESVFVGVEKRALAEGDVETLRGLATRSRLNTAATTMGQRIRTLGERDSSSPVGLIQEVAQAREAAHGNVEAAKAETVAEIRAEVAKAASTPDKFAQFLKTLECE
jgi:hypothetical protein